MKIFKRFMIMALFAQMMILALPAKALTDMEEKPTSIAEVTGQGKWTVIELWASDCHMCRASIHHTVAFAQANPDIAVYGIALDDIAGKQAAQDFIDEHNVSFPTLLSNPSEIDKYLYTTAQESFIGTPTFMVFNPQGQLQALQPGVVTEEELTAYIRSQKNG